MSALLRSLAALVVAAALAIVPVFGNAGGEPGLVNLPGSSGGQSKNASAPPRLKVVRSASDDLVLRLDPSMAGAIVLISTGNSTPVAASTENGSYTVTAASMQQFMQLGITKVTLLFVALTGQLEVELYLDAATNKVTVVAR